MIQLTTFSISDSIRPLVANFDNVKDARRWIGESNYRGFTHKEEIDNLVPGKSIKFSHETIKMEEV